MRLLRRNTQPVYYALYTGKTAVVDSEGNYTGEYELQYSTPVAIRAYVTPSRSSIFRVQDSVDREMFGNKLDYNEIMIVDDINCPIDEQTLLYVNHAPAEGVEPDHTVEGVAKSLNYISYAIRKINR